MRWFNLPFPASAAFLIPRSLYHLREIVKGHIDFILVRIKMKCMEIAIVRKESVGMREYASIPGQSRRSFDLNCPLIHTPPPPCFHYRPAGSPLTTESETLTRYEVMDGAPVRGDRIPLSLPLASVIALTPTMVVANGLLSVRYFLNLVLIDDADRRYFKTQEIILYRKNS
jgi:vacuolar protein sorting-associated protein 26